KTGGTLIHGLSGTIDWHIVRRLALGSVPTSIVALFVLSLLDIKGATARILITVLVAGALFLTALVLIGRERIRKRYAARIGSLDPRHTAILTLGGRGGTRSSRVAHLGRRWRNRRHCSRIALSTAATGAHRRVRYCARGSANVGNLVATTMRTAAR